jgi:hypothetical protein
MIGTSHGLLHYITDGSIVGDLFLEDAIFQESIDGLWRQLVGIEIKKMMRLGEITW